ncbi:MAG: hypothetical protein RBU30_16845 [Polyangia bacterium]|jgi:hypothetical protein|nr:hypothetical protein [Polyangia bacterium]
MAFGRKRKDATDGSDCTRMELERQLDELEERIQELEKQAKEPKDLMARELALVDGRGQPLMVLSAGNQEGPELRMMDRKGRVRLRLRVVSDMPIFELQDSRENSKTWFGVGADGNPAIQLRDRTGRDRLAIQVSRRKGAKISVVDPGGKASAVMAEGVLLADEGIVRKLYLKAEAEEERANRPHLTVLQGGLSELDDEERERR